MLVWCDIICHECRIMKKDVKLGYGEQPKEICPECGKSMKKKIDFGSFELKYNNKTDICDFCPLDIIPGGNDSN